MALQFIIGGSGSGKTTWIQERILTEAKENRKKNYYVIVPEQFTMQTQKALIDRQEQHAIMNIDVVSFDRLAYRSFDELGKNNLIILEDTGKNLILRKLAEDCKDQLTTLKNQIHKINYIDQIKSLISEFMQYGIEPEDLEDYLERMQPNSALYYKLKDMLLLYQAFERYLKEGYVTSERILSVLADCVAESALLDGAVLAFDGFTGFTPVQMNLLQELFAVAGDCYVTVTMDPCEDPYADKGIQDLFYMSRKMVRSVSKTAIDAGCALEEPVFLQREQGKGRFSDNPVLRHLEQQIFRPGARAYAEASLSVEEGYPGISIHSVAMPREELLYAAMKIRQMVRQYGYRYQDFTIVSGNAAGYEKYVKEIFEMYEIPYFTDVKETIYYHPFTEWIRSFVEMLKTGFEYDSVFRFLRCGLSGFTMDEVDVLDNYVLDRGIRGFRKWKEKWVHPSRQNARGVKRTKEEQMESLLALNALRERFVAQTEPVWEQLQRGTVQVKAFILALYEVICSLKIQEQLKEKQLEQEVRGEEALAASYGQIYRIVMELFDKVVDLLGEEQMPIRELGQILDAGFLAAKVGAIPPGADCVIIGDIERTRLPDVKVLFFLGVNDGIVPKMADRKNLLSQYDRELLAREQLELAPTTREQVFLQKFYLYLSMTKPRDCLFLSYARMDSMGTAQKPSYLIASLEKLYPELQVQEIAAGFQDEMMTAGSSLQQYVKGLRQTVEKLEAMDGEPLTGEVEQRWRALHHWRSCQPAYEEETRQLLEAAFAVYDEGRLPVSLAKKLYGEKLYHSVTRLEQYFRCAYSHFLQYGLCLAERPEYTFEASDLGTVFHTSLECYCNKMQEEGLDWFTIQEKKQEQLLEAAVSETLLSMDTSILNDSARNQYMTRRISNILRRSVWALTRQIRKGEFVPLAYEIPFYQDLEFDLDQTERGNMVITGRIDRLDTYENDAQIYVKIMDYKSGKKTFDLQKIYNGQDLQLPVYMHAALEKMRQAHGEKDIIPGGMLYYQLDDPVIEGETGKNAEELEQKVFEHLRPEGLVNSDPAVLDKFDGELSGKSDVIPVTLNKDGSLSKRGCSVADRGQFDILDRFVMRKMKQAGEEILQGRIDLSPLSMKQVDGCTWCPYKEICGFDSRISGYTKQQPEAYPEDVLWEKLAKEGNENNDVGE